MLSKKVIQKALKKSNGNIKLAAKILNCKYETLYYNVKKYNIEHSFKTTRISEKNIPKIKKLYKQLNSVKKVAEEINCSTSGLKKFMLRHGLTINQQVKYTANFDYFKEETPETFYWAGFIAADGCVFKRKYSYITKIGLALKDKDHLESFKNALNSSHPLEIRHYVSKVNNAKLSSCSIVLCSKDMFNDLAKFNIIPRKTEIYTFPKWLINHKFAKHFMRGYFDGDGSFCYLLDKNKKVSRIRFSLRGNIKFLEIYEKILRKNLKLKFKKITFETTGILAYNGDVVNKIADFLYSDATIYLPRKHDKVYKKC